METKFGVVESRFNYKGHECLVVFTRNGARNGYVSYNKIVDCFDLDIDCHGGLTFSGPIAKEYNPSKYYYIGFDCQHCYDGHDYMLAYKYGLITESELNYYQNLDALFPTDEVVWSKEDVEKECKHIVDQIEKEKE